MVAPKFFLGLALCSGALARTVRETLRITWKDGAPNGQSRELIHTNGQFPGPALVWDEDDDIEVTVINQMDQNVTVHWHGLLQQGTPWSDGVPGLSQSPIHPGDTFVYKFKATPAGNHWYHSHEKMSLVDGLYGAIYIKPKQDRTGLWKQISNSTKDINAMEKAAKHPEYLVVSDWSRYTSDQYWKASTDSGYLIFCVDSILVNGQGEVYCPGEKFLNDQIAPGLKDGPFPPDTKISDKGCFPLNLDVVQGGPYNNTKHPEKVPPNIQSGCVASKHKNATIEVDPHHANGWVSMHFVSAATIVQFMFSIDEHEFWIYEIDGNYVNPQKYVSAVMSAGETFSIMMKLDQKPGKYTIRVPDSGATQVMTGFAELVYKNSHHHKQKPSEPWVSFGGLPLNDKAEKDGFIPWILESDHMSPWPATPPRPGPADEEHLLAIGRIDNPHTYTMNTKHLYPVNFQQDKPLLFYPNATLDTENENLVVRTKNGSWVDLILQVSTLPGDLAAFEHFIHKHGSKTWRIGFGEGYWNYTSVSEAMKDRPKDFNLETPGLRDTWITQFSQGQPYWSVLRYYVDNPGPWLFHCHIELHLMGGMGIAILDGVDAWPEDIPQEYLPPSPGCKAKH